jgi:4-hydroxy-tetrahydrodipicolinate synthase
VIKLNKLNNISGSMVALVTPMSPGGEINWQDLDKLIDYHLANHTVALVVLGTTGEAATISLVERQQVVKHVIDRVAGRILVIIGTGHNSTAQAINLTNLAKEQGADAALIVTPYYNKPSQNGLIAHYKAIASNVDLPIILYNVPGRTACDLLPETVAVLANQPNIVGLKEAVADPNRIKKLVELVKSEHPDFSLLSGDDESFLAFLQAGGDGIISVTCNIVPKVLAEICNYARDKNWSKCIDLNNKLIKLHQDLFVVSNPMPVKWALYYLGLITSAECRLPLLPLEEQHHEKIINALAQANMLKNNNVNNTNLV